MLNWFLASLPVIIILVLMTVLRWGASRAGLAGWLAALLIAHLAFAAGPRLMLTAHLKAAFIILDILLIVWGAFLLFRVTDEAGAIRSLAEALPRLTSDRTLQALIIGWVFATFLQGVGGFGVPVAITAPLLVGLGFSRSAAMLIPSIGHGWAVTFGSLALSFQALIAASGIAGEALVTSSCILLGLAGMLAGFQITRLTGGWSEVKRHAGSVLLIGTVMGLSQFLIARAGLWSSASFGAGLAGMVVLTLVIRSANSSSEPGSVSFIEFLPGLASYIILIGIIFLVQYQPLHELLGRLVLSSSFPAVETGLGFITPAGSSRKIPLLRHTGMLLGYSALLSFTYYRFTGQLERSAGKRILLSTFRGIRPASLGIAAAAAMALVMSHSGMIDTLARGIAGTVGGVFPVASPWIGALGAFITGSNTNSNVIFASLQAHTAGLLGLNTAVILGAQTAGAAVGSAAAPGKIIVGASTTGLSGQEGRVLRALLKPIAFQILVISAGAWVMALLT